MEAIDVKIGSIRRATEDGLAETARANERLSELKAERERIVAASEVCGEPPQIGAATAMTYPKELPRLLKHATPSEKKELVRARVEDIRLAPGQLDVAITYRVPEPVVNELLAGARYEAIQDLASEWFLSKWELPRKGRQLRRPAVVAVG